MQHCQYLYHIPVPYTRYLVPFLVYRAPQTSVPSSPVVVPPFEMLASSLKPGVCAWHNEGIVAAASIAMIIE